MRLKSLKDLEAMVDATADDPSKVHTLIIELAREPLMPFIRTPNTQVTEYGTCPKDSTHNASVIRHWDGEKYDDTHFLCITCGIAVKFCEANKQVCQIVRPDGKVRWPGVEGMVEEKAINTPRRSPR